MKEKLILLGAATIFVVSIINHQLIWTIIALGIGLYLQQKNIFQEWEEQRKECLSKRKESK